MFLSVFDVFKIGVGPSSSHTMGPMSAGRLFIDLLRSGEGRIAGAGEPARLKATLYGSLAFTGKGHASDRAIALGFLGIAPAELDPDRAEAELTRLASERQVHHEGLPELAFDPESDLHFNYDGPLPGHANGMMLEALDAKGGLVLRQVFYSIGGGFIVTEEELEANKQGGPQDAAVDCPYPFATAAEMLRFAAKSGLTIAEMKRENENAVRPAEVVDQGIKEIWQAMNGCIDRGLTGGGILPGGLKVRRRAGAIYRALKEESGRNDCQPHVVNDWISVYAMAVNEENAAGGRVVTAPTNGAAGVVPAVLRYYLDHCVAERKDRIDTFLLTAAAIGGLIKHNASISGAEVGCQGEVGSASAMAAAGLCAVLGGTPEQVENAAEIALEHHLGMTCDPAGGLVQVPCIERNGLGAIKAVAAASLALRGDGKHFMPLDNCVETMRQTGLEMSEKYKETSLGGLAVNLPEC